MESSIKFNLRIQLAHKFLIYFKSLKLINSERICVKSSLKMITPLLKDFQKTNLLHIRISYLKYRKHVCKMQESNYV